MKTTSKIGLGVLISGRGSNLEAIIKACESSEIPAAVKIVISDNANAAGITKAKKHNLNCRVIERQNFHSREKFEEEIATTLKESGVGLVCLAGFMRIVGKTILSAFPNRIINIHPALLPSFPGLAAQKQAIDYGVKISGCTVHFVDEKTDHGPIILQSAVAVKEDDTEETLRERILEEEHRIYPKAIGLIAEDKIKIEGRLVKIM